MDHEDLKTVIGRLVEAWALELDVDLRGFGSTTFRKEAAQRGLEPDECYTVGPLVRGDAPDIAIEVVIASPLLDKLAVYAGLAIPEVWPWRDGSLLVHRLVGWRPEPRSGSEVLPRLDLALLASFVRPGESQTRLVKDHPHALRGGD